ncbi:CHASE2 domain-containing protein [Komagataeibacter rhaeticus]|uniref:CHASE2 domain-containing protein n=1 Tax=Komagataeibacter rhaeticus TaxID=215221 RepID=A0A181C9Y0_9PROT|nr:CHASE2 domain-containing protein [Komagataeibacter rhaeticus]QIP35171.1 CHASE2 domain-containing protein [Komagataeibacter rhaeticus]QOC47731.1 CHASE2 domain-containing protein [Komagataeibacter rhaeticus]WPP22907.1 CHASE2 domain-containing protein [Komagataeibacter rhaeticus]SAY48354.1 CHASE2 domain protein [Komagataeibacter rhaeticus]
MFWVLFKLLDPLAMESATKQSSARFLAGLSDAFYGMQDSPARDRISVVEVTDKDLSGEYFATTWPLTYARHAEVIDRMLDAGPAAIMVDIRFNAERAGESLQDTFGPVIARAKRMGVPLFFARGQLGGGYDDLPEPLTQSQIINGWKMPAGFYPLLLAPPPPQASGDEDGGDGEEGEDAPRTVPVGAFALYRTLCASGWQKSCPADMSEHTFGQPLVERWGLRAPRYQDLYAKTDGCLPDIHDMPVLRVWDAARIGARALFGYFSKDIRQKCQYHLTVPVRYLDRNLEPDVRNLEPAFRNRVVFYGTHINGDHDVVDVPMIGQEPGVHEHAMALDNLLTYNERYFREPGEWISTRWLKIDSAECLEFVVWLFIAAYSYSMIHEPVSVSARASRVLTAACVAMSVLLGVATSLYATNPDRWHMLMLPALGLFGVALAAWAYAHHVTRSIGQWISTNRSRAIMVAVVFSASLLGVDVGLLRHGTYGFWALFLVYGLLAVLLCLSILTSASNDQNTGKEREKGKRYYFSKLLLSVTVVAVMFVINEDLLLWPMEDWIGFVLLWLALSETGEDTGFVWSVLTPLTGEKKPEENS